jgi:hypothetical protein
LLEVVPASGLNGFTTFLTLQAAVNAASSGDVVQVEPGSAPGDATLAAPANLTIQGDPAFGGAGGLRASNTRIGTLTLTANSDAVRNLYLNTVRIAAGVTGEVISDNVFTGKGNGIFQTFGGVTPPGNGHNLVTGNTFLDDAAVSLGNTAGSGAATAAGDQVIDNSFTYFGDVVPLTLTNEVNGLQVLGNKVVNPNTASINGDALDLIDCDGVVEGNTVYAPNNISAVFIEDSGGGETTELTFSDNVVTGGNETVVGSALEILHRSSPTFSVGVFGNSLAGNAVGVEVAGDGAGGGNSDYGSVSINGNDFRGYTGGSGNFAMEANDGGHVDFAGINASGNVFSVANPQTVVDSTNAPGTIFLTGSPLTGGPASLTAMFETMGAGAPPADQVNAFGNAAPLTQAVAAVRSAGAVTSLVDGLYVGLLGRAPVGGEDQGWVDALGSASITEEQLIAGFVGSAEYYNRAGQGSVNPNGAWVESLYLNLLGRQGSATEVNAWAAAAQTQGLAAVAAGIVYSAEFRTRQIQAYYGAAPIGALPAADILKRSALPTAAEISGYVFSGLDLRTVQVLLLESAEFAANG